MRSYEEIYNLAAKRKGGAKALDALLATTKPKSKRALSAVGDDRCLAEMTRAVFQAGFNWTVINTKWNGFEEAFEGFDPHRWAMMSDEDLDRLVKDTRIVRNAQKIKSVAGNAAFVLDLAQEYGSAGKAFATWPQDDYAGLITLMNKKGSRLGGATAQYFLRRLGRDGFVLSKDVAARLIAEGVVDKPPTSARAMQSVQAAFNDWAKESGRTLTQISRTLAFSIG
ncbi:MAG: DNA-3-methyladenine glycosylase I [Pseudomonadota bacterium]